MKAQSSRWASSWKVVSARVHVGYAESAGDPEKLIYFRLAVVTVRGKLPKVLPLADSQIGRPGIGLPLACICIPHESEAVNRFQTFVPELRRGKVFIVTASTISGRPSAAAHQGGICRRRLTAVRSSTRRARSWRSTPSAGRAAGQEGTELKLHYAAGRRR